MRTSIYQCLKLLVSATLLVLTLGGLPAHAAEDYPAQEIPAQQRCPVCGMYTAQFPAWATQVVFKDHSMAAPESPAELFRFLQDVKKYDPKHTAADIAKIYVTDYVRRNWIDARQAFYVEGSKQRGPMTADLPAFTTQSAAEIFMKEEGGHLTTFDALVGANMSSGHGGHDMHGNMKHDTHR
jgi:nitrous oxide reductase accessory protein NosL